ncbi:hypothetical protein AGLY_001867 [Aphis glycines]|uniref:Uncharacterized protein n=1 Tax=Aphis glycines TaxID=307491 RepID=A0A6G0U5J3_APHGL|nr:hypothetical protein AGLY_001867 [Aphis glycines]
MRILVLKDIKRNTLKSSQESFESIDILESESSPKHSIAVFRLQAIMAISLAKLLSDSSDTPKNNSSSQTSLIGSLISVSILSITLLESLQILYNTSMNAHPNQKINMPIVVHTSQYFEKNTFIIPQNMHSIRRVKLKIYKKFMYLRLLQHLRHRFPSWIGYMYLILKLLKSFSFLESEWSDECIDFTMISHNIFLLEFKSLVVLQTLKWCCFSEKYDILSTNQNLSMLKNQLAVKNVVSTSFSYEDLVHLYTTITEMGNFKLLEDRSGRVILSKSHLITKTMHLNWFYNDIIYNFFMKTRLSISTDYYRSSPCQSAINNNMLFRFYSIDNYKFLKSRTSYGYII